MAVLATSFRCLPDVLFLAPKLDGRYVLSPNFATLSMHWVLLGSLPTLLPYCLCGLNLEASRHEAVCKPISEGMAEEWHSSLVNLSSDPGSTAEPVSFFTREDAVLPNLMTKCRERGCAVVRHTWPIHRPDVLIVLLLMLSHAVGLCTSGKVKCA